MSNLENYTYDEIAIGQTANYSKTLTEDDLILFAAVSGDVNPVHLDPDFAATTMFGERIGHGAWTGAVVSAAIALELPGPGTIYLGQNLSFRSPVKVGDTITVNLDVAEKKDDKKCVTLTTLVVNQHGKTVAKGTSEVIAPTAKPSLPRPAPPVINTA